MIAFSIPGVLIEQFVIPECLLVARVLHRAVAST